MLFSFLVKYSNKKNKKKEQREGAELRGVIIGGRTPGQVSENLEAIEEDPLKDNIAAEIEELWELVKDKAAVDNYSQVCCLVWSFTLNGL